ncbi:MAG: chemotaxis protein CheW [Deltaproteobacteria bacterium]|nr:chemotaxis protein CheW [Deltaproteobacteria bacterium]
MELLLVFELGGEAHAVPAAEVVKVVEPGSIAALPRLPPQVRGITHHRGRVMTVVDLGLVVSSRFPAQDVTRGRLLLMERGGGSVALLVGVVREIVSLAPEAGTPPAREGGAIARIHVHQGRALNVLDTELIFNRIGGLCQAEDSPPRRTSAIAHPAGA